MKKLLLLFSLIIVNQVFAVNSLLFYIDRCQFSDTENNLYLETTISIDGHSVVYKKTPQNTFQASVNVVFTLEKKQGNQNAMVFADKFNLYSLELKDTTEESKKLAFTHLKRLPVKVGNYVIKVEMHDNYRTGNASIAIEDEVEVKPINVDEFAFSNIQYVASMKKAETSNEFVKYGWEIVPFATDQLFINQEKLNFYVELYHSDKTFTEDYVLQAQIKCGSKSFFEYNQTVKKSPKPMDIFMGTFDIHKLPSQNYTLEIRALQKGELKRMVIRQFDVLNSEVKPDLNTYLMFEGDAAASIFGKYTEEELRGYIPTLRHNSAGAEIEMGKQLKTKEQMVNYLYSFWKKREKPEYSVSYLWDTHLKKLDYVNQNFKSVLRPGWQTDRGRVFMLYGIPSNVERYPAETNLLPYEVWRYDRLGAQSSVQFIFCDTDLATNEYTIIHSTKYGELNNPRWRAIVTKGVAPIDYESDPAKMDTKLNIND